MGQVSRLGPDPANRGSFVTKNVTLCVRVADGSDGGGVSRQVTRDEAEDPELWDAWVASACDEVGVDTSIVNVELVHRFAKTVAGTGMRPMVPVGAFLLGCAVAAGADVEDAARRLEGLDY